MKIKRPYQERFPGGRPQTWGKANDIPQKAIEDPSRPTKSQANKPPKWPANFTLEDF